MALSRRGFLGSAAAMALVPTVPFVLPASAAPAGIATGGSYLTLAEWARTARPDQIQPIADLLNKTNEIMRDLQWERA